MVQIFNGLQQFLLSHSVLFLNDTLFNETLTLFLIAFCNMERKAQKHLARETIW
jgi:hypothetical protein